jgi:hypothetical protein
MGRLDPYGGVYSRFWGQFSSPAVWIVLISNSSNGLPLYMTGFVSQKGSSPGAITLPTLLHLAYTIDVSTVVVVLAPGD